MTSRLSRKLDQIEKRAGIKERCLQCAGRDLVKVWVEYLEDAPWSDNTPPNPKPGPALCPRCGRDRLRLFEVQIEYVTAPLPQ